MSVNTGIGGFLNEYWLYWLRKYGVGNNKGNC